MNRITSICGKRVDSPKHRPDSPRPEVKVTGMVQSLNLEPFKKNDYSTVNIPKKLLDGHIHLYETQTKDINEYRGPIPEIVILRNISNRYSYEESLEENDVEIVISLIKLNRQERCQRNYELLHDTMFDSMVNTFDLIKHLERRVLFSMHSFD